MDALVSIVMPVYNSQKYLPEALNSLLHQSYKNFELICVDDGSTDRSADILSRYADMDSRIIILRQKHSSAGAARNIGMDAASGKYLMFLDSDDIFKKGMLSYLVRKAEKKNTDILYFGFYDFSKDIRHRSAMGIPYHSRKVCSSLDRRDDIFHIAQGMPWNKLYKRKFVIDSGIKFQNLRSNNDEFFTKTIVLEAERILFLNRRFIYHRTNNADSLQGSYDVRSGDFAKSTYAIYHSMLDRGQYSTYQESFNDFVLEFYMLTLDKIRTIDEFYDVCEIINRSLNRMNISKQSESILKHPAKEMWFQILDGKMEESLLNLYFYMRSYYCKKSSAEYRIGRSILQLLHVKDYN